VIETADLQTIIRTHANGYARSQQTTVGCSQVGHPCPRHLVHALNGTPKVNTDSDPLAAYIGTAVHASLAQALEADNAQLGRQRWLIEQPVNIPTPEGDIPGSVDAYDTDTKTVLDWKCVGEASRRKYKGGDIGSQYRSQIHLYAFGLVLLGYEVEHVALAFVPRNGRLADLTLHVEPYDENGVVETTLRRFAAIHTLAEIGNPAAAPTGDAPCSWCPWYLPAATNLTEACPGHQPNPTQPDNK
jgi:hypothetical protein